MRPCFIQITNKTWLCDCAGVAAPGEIQLALLYFVVQALLALSQQGFDLFLLVICSASYTLQCFAQRLGDAGGYSKSSDP